MEITAIQVDVLAQNQGVILSLQVTHPAWFADAYVCRQVERDKPLPERMGRLRSYAFHNIPSGLPLQLGTHQQYVKSAILRMIMLTDHLISATLYEAEETDELLERSNEARKLKEWHFRLDGSQMITLSLASAHPPAPAY